VSPRKDRIAVVLDTNVLIGYYLSTKKDSANSRVYHLWRTRRKLQLIISDEIMTEYLEILDRLGVPPLRITRLKQRFERRETVSPIKLGTRPAISRDPDDNVMIATALGGKAQFLITNDRDLLDIPSSEQQKYRFQIIKPADFLKLVKE
jgi:putative PIN family toxin of toxin-antitoxin system